MKYMKGDLKIFIFQFFLLCIFAIFSIFSTITKSKNTFISKIDLFPQNIDNNFTFTVSHPSIEYHHLYAVFILEVNCATKSETQKLYIYPGFTKKLDHRLKESLFHIVHFDTHRFNTSIILRFFREASECTFTVEYSAIGAEQIHLRSPQDSVVVYKETILLFRPPILTLSVLSEDGHQKGLSVGKRGIVECTAKDGFPHYSPSLTFDKGIIKVDEPFSPTGGVVSIKVVAALSDHGTRVTCTCGTQSKSITINVFHHALSVQIIPSKQYWFKQGSFIQCKRFGSSYPSSVVRWTVSHLNDTSRQYFSYTSSPSMSTIHINAITPNYSRWSLNCSSLNIIPPLDHGGPFLLLNITIGEKVASSTILSNYPWIIVILIVIFIIVVSVTSVCASNHCRCSKPSVKDLNKDAAPMRPYLPVDQQDFDGDHNSMTKDQECFV